MDASTFRVDPHSLPGPHILSVGPRVSLEITRGRVQERVREVRGRVFLIGAAHDCDLVLGDLQFPEAYAYLFVDGSKVSIRCLGAGPPLLVCGEVVESAELFHGDLMAFGPFELRVRIDEPANSRASGGNSPGRGRSSERDDGSDDASHEVRLLLADIHRALAEDAPSSPADDEAVEYARPQYSTRACA